MLEVWIQQISEFLYFIGSLKNTRFLQPLKPEEELQYLKLLKEKDIDARNKLIEHNLRLVAHIVKKYDFRKETQDLISIGTIGLIKAIDSYDLDRGKKLTTYASRCIENEILMYLRNNKNNFQVISLDAATGSDQSTNLLDTIANPEEVDIAAQIVLQQNTKKLMDALRILDVREHYVIIRRYGLLNHREHKQNEIAKQMKISRSYVSRIEKKALYKLYKSFLND